MKTIRSLRSHAVERTAWPTGTTAIVTAQQAVEDVWLCEDLSTSTPFLLTGLPSAGRFSQRWGLVRITGWNDEGHVPEAELVPESAELIRRLMETAGQEPEVPEHQTVKAIAPLLNGTQLWRARWKAGMSALLIRRRSRLEWGGCYRVQTVPQNELTMTCVSQESLFREYQPCRVVIGAKIAITRLPKDGRLVGYNVELEPGIHGFLPMSHLPFERGLGDQGHQGPENSRRLRLHEGQCIDVVVTGRRKRAEPILTHPLALDQSPAHASVHLQRCVTQLDERGLRAALALAKVNPADETVSRQIQNGLTTRSPASFDAVLAWIIEHDAGDPELRGRMQEFLVSDAPLHRRVDVAWALSTFPHEPDHCEHVDFLHEQLSKADEYARGTAVNALVTLGQIEPVSKLDEIRKLLRGVNWEITRDALAARNEQALPAIPKLVESESTLVRMRAASVLGCIIRSLVSLEVLAECVDVARQLLQHADTNVRFEAAIALREFPWRLHQRVVTRGAGSALSRSARIILKKITDLCETQYSKDPSYRIRRQMFWSIPHEEDPHEIEPIGLADRASQLCRRGLQDESAAVRFAAHERLSILSRADMGDGYDLLSTRDTKPVANTTQSIQLRDLLAADEELRATCFWQLVDGETDHLDSLRGGLNRSNRQIVLNCIRAIHHIGPAARAVAQDLIAILVESRDLLLMQAALAALNSLLPGPPLRSYDRTSLIEEFAEFYRRCHVRQSVLPDPSVVLSVVSNLTNHGMNASDVERILRELEELKA